MARFLVWSDLHNEFWQDFDLPDLSAPVDGVLIGGDTHTRGRHLDIPAAAARKYGCPVVLIWGNHEAYGSIWADLLAVEARQLAALKAEGLDIRVLHGAVTELAGARIIGATLWTDFRLYPELEALARTVVPRMLNDYHDIRTAPGRRFTGADMLAVHAEQKATVFAALAEPYPGPTIVITHHLPVHQLIHPAREIGRDQDRALSAGFANDLWQEIKTHNIHCWIWGHSHEGDAWTGQGDHGPIRFLTNQRGYPGEGTSFDPTFVLEV